jgi:uroporphyrinogen-III synthase/uroporphyrinogen III methyltransferase/synthase
MNALPLTGRRILVTRAAHQAGKLSEGLRALGAEPIAVPVIEIQPPPDFALLDRALRELDSYDWLILTSANTVRALADRAAYLKISVQKSAPQQVAAVGEATAEAARHAGLAVTLVPESYVAESLIAKLLQHRHEVSGHDFSRAVETHKSKGALAPEGSLRGQRILLARAAVARDVIPDALRAAGATVDIVDAYRNVMPESAPALLRDALQTGIAAAAFTSSSSVTHLADAAQKAGIGFPFAGVKAISIGPITSKTLRDLGWEPAAEASPSDVPGLIQAIARALSQPR